MRRYQSKTTYKANSSVLPQGVESWTLTKKVERELQDFEIFRRMLKIPRTDQSTNEEVLNRVSVKNLRTQYYGRVDRNEKYKTFQLVLSGKERKKKEAGVGDLFPNGIISGSHQ